MTPARTFKVADRVVHFQYGTGTIAAIESAYTVIDFDRNGRKKFLTSMVQLDPTDVGAPARPAAKSRSRSAAPKTAAKSGKKAAWGNAPVRR